MSYSVREEYIKYVGRGAGGFYKFFKKKFVTQEIIDFLIEFFMAQ